MVVYDIITIICKIMLQELYNRYLSGESIKSLAKELNLSTGGLQYRFNKGGYKLSKTSKLVNHNYFNKIDSEIKAYLLGFFVADGCIYQHVNKKSWYFEIGVQYRDKYIIDLYQREIAPLHNIYFTKNSKSASIYRFRINSLQIAEDIIALGYMPRKTYAELSIPNISKDLIPHFIRGYFDGDGTVGLYISKTDNRYVRNFKIVSKTSTLLEEINSIFDNKLYLNALVKKKVYSLVSSDYKIIKTLYDYLYTDANFYFERKRLKFKEAALTPSELVSLKTDQPCND